MRRLLLPLALVISTPVFATTRTWTGAVGGGWSVAGNWAGNVAPSPGDDLVFPASAANQFNCVNDFPSGTAFHSISINGVSYNIGGNAVSLGAGGLRSDNNGRVRFPITLAASQTFVGNGVGSNVSNSAGSIFFVDGPIDLNGKTLTLSAAPGSSDNLIDGNISGNGTIIKNGLGGWALLGDNSFGGQVIVDEGILGASSLGVSDDTLANGTIVHGGGSLSAGLNLPAREYIRLSGSGSSYTGSSTLNAGFLAGTVELADANVVISGSGILAGKVTGPGGLGLSGGRTITLANPANDFAGGVTSLGASLKLNASPALPANVSLDVPTKTNFDLDGQSTTITSLSGQGNLRLGGGGTLTLTHSSGTYGGTSTGSGVVIVSGGDTTWTGVNAYTGTFSHTGGTFTFSGGSLTAALTQTGGTLVLSSGATMHGVTVGGGVFSPVGTSSSGDLALKAAATYATALDSVVHVNGTVTLGGARLSLAGGGFGNAFMIVDNDGDDPVIGTFADLPEGGAVSVDGAPYTISYRGGSGNDVVVTAAPGIPDVTFTTAAPVIIAGSSATLTWMATNATSVIIDGFGAQPLSGAIVVSPSQTTTYLLTAIGPNGTAIKQVTVSVRGPRERPVHH